MRALKPPPPNPIPPPIITTPLYKSTKKIDTANPSTTHFPQNSEHYEASGEASTSTSSFNPTGEIHHLPSQSAQDQHTHQVCPTWNTQSSNLDWRIDNQEQSEADDLRL
jgi:hypothetical protein